MSTAALPRAENVVIAGPSGALQAIVEEPRSAFRQVGIICHPHPLYGGTMTNKVVHMLGRSFLAVGAAAVRFNFRGVGASDGAYDEGRGETADATTVIDWALQRWPGKEIWIAGFSFGGAVAVRAAVERDVSRLITVAPAIARVAVGPELPDVPWLIVQGGRDELVSAADTQRWVESLPRCPQLELIAEADHFFHGKLTVLRDIVVNWLSRSMEERTT